MSEEAADLNGLRVDRITITDKPLPGHEFLPTTGSVRSAYASLHPDAGGMFDRWLAAHDAEVSARAWDEGLNVRRDFRGDVMESNPYRQGRRP